MLLGARTAMWGGKRLPYKARLEYVGVSNNSSYVDCGYILTGSDSIELVIEKTNAATEGSVFGSRSSANSDNFSVFSFSYSVNADYSAGSQRVSVRASDIIGGSTTIVISPTLTSISFGGNTVSRVNTPVTFTTPLSCCLWKISGNPTFSYGDVSVLTNELKIYSESTLTRHLIPVLDLNDEPKMYDLVTQSYPTHVGSFIAGPEV